MAATVPGSPAIREWVIAKKGGSGQFLGQIKTWWNWENADSPHVCRYTREDAARLIKLLPWRLRKDAQPLPQHCPAPVLEASPPASPAIRPTI